jgi:hypothetical protein
MMVGTSAGGLPRKGTPGALPRLRGRGEQGKNVIYAQFIQRSTSRLRAQRVDTLIITCSSVHLGLASEAALHDRLTAYLRW